MSKIDFNELIRNTKHVLTKHSPEILTGLGIAGMISTTILAVKATPKAMSLIGEKKEELEVEKLPAGEIVKTTWKCYIPSFGICCISIACLIGASATNFRRNAALATAYELSTKALDEYKSAVIETIGEKKEQFVREKVSENQIEKNPVSKNEVIITDNGDTLCYESISGRYFKSDIEKIKRALNVINRIVLTDNSVSLNEFYDELELDHTDMGYELGWNVDDGYIDISFDAKIADDGTPCIVLYYSKAPKYGYNKFG